MLVLLGSSADTQRISRQNQGFTILLQKPSEQRPSPYPICPDCTRALWVRVQILTGYPAKYTHPVRLGFVWNVIQSVSSTPNNLTALVMLLKPPNNGLTLALCICPECARGALRFGCRFSEGLPPKPAVKLCC